MQIEALVKDVLDWHGEREKAPSWRTWLRWGLVRLFSPPDMYSRYDVLLEKLRQDVSQTDSILEIGSGATGLTRYWRREVYGVDVCFDGPDLGYLRKIQQSGETLPFADREFDWVVSSDVWEHLPGEVRRRVIHQMLRVAKKGVISVAPSGEKSVATEEKLAAWLRQRGREMPEWMQEHRQFGLPDREDTVWTIQEEAEKLGRTIEVRTKMISNRVLWLQTWKICSMAEQRFAYRLLTMLFIPLALPPFSRLWRLGQGYRCCWEVRFRD